MIRLSEEQRGILNYYSGTKEEVFAELWKAIPFIEDVELREESEDLMAKLEKMADEVFAEENSIGIMYDIEEYLKE